MRENEIESKFKTMETQIKTLENQVRTLKDISEIEKLQRAYGYYLEHWMCQEIIDCFSNSDDVVLDWLPGGIYLGKKGVIRYFEQFKEPNPEFLHQLMQLSGIVDVDPDGKTAKGRWYGYGALAGPRGKGMSQGFHNGIYENEYVKEDGKWKIKKIKWVVNYNAPPAEGWVKPERIAAADPDFKLKGPKPDIPPIDFNTKYPSGYILPFHYTHPVTGKKTSEEQRNAPLKLGERKRKT